MNNQYKEKREHENAELRRFISETLSDSSAFLNKYFFDLDISEYKYDILKAVNELCLDEHEVFQLIEDYIIQILKSKLMFYKYIDELKQRSIKNELLDYTDIKSLAHRNLGVARNLRIKDASKILEIIMRESDLDYLILCVRALEISAVKLNPKCAYETLSLIHVKDFL